MVNIDVRIPLNKLALILWSIDYLLETVGHRIVLFLIFEEALH